jgi:hypothetical protein
MLTNLYNEIVLLGLLIYSYRSYNVLLCTGWLPLACLLVHINKLYYKVSYHMDFTNNSIHRLWTFTNTKKVKAQHY